MVKKLLSVNNYYYLRGGAEKVFLDHNDLMEEEGWQVAPFCMQGEKNLKTPWSAYFVKEIEFGETYSPLQKAINATKIIHSFEAKNHISRLIRDFKPDVAHAHNIYHHLSTSILAELKRQGVPVVLTLHDLKLACPAYTMMSNGELCEACKGGRLHQVFSRRCMKGSALLSGLVMLEAYFNQTFGMYRNNVSRYVVPSQFYIEKFVEWGFAREQFLHIPNYVDIEEQASGKMGDSKVGDYFVFAGRLAHGKGVNTLIKAAARIKAKLIIAGTGPDEAQAKQLTVELGEDGIQFVGHLNKPELKALVAGSRAVIVPSEWYENCPMSVIEAFAAGKIVIGADVGGISEMIDEGQDGFKYTMGSEQELADKMNQVRGLSTVQLLELGQSAIEKVQTRYSKANYREKTLALYNELMP